MEVLIGRDLDVKKKDCLDYAGMQVCLLALRVGERVVEIWINGETRFWGNDGTLYKNIPAEAKGYDKYKVEWENNNWFEVVKVISGELDDPGEVAYDLDEAAEIALNLLLDSEEWN